MHKLVKRWPVWVSLFVLLLLFPSACLAGQVVYKVKPGDSLYKIALRYGSTVQSLKTINHLKSNLIYPGQKLVVKTDSRSAAAASKQVVAAKVTSSPINQTISRAALNTGEVSRSDFDLLARLITAEAGGEPYQAQLAVGAVVLNRVKSDLFPDSIRAVIYQVEDGHYQFTPVLNGWIDRPATDQARKAASEVLAGADPTNGALYFYSRGITNSFLLSRPVCFTAGQMVFTR
ncbi:MAG: cell wall hydrolase [Desulfurispora sp.]|uniref:cell wall hydrolase n=1 Tax=Desulfurispora sp. TaxID=3014275 RepID=UPI0040497EB2